MVQTKVVNGGLLKGNTLIEWTEIWDAFKSINPADRAFYAARIKEALSGVKA